MTMKATMNKKEFAAYVGIGVRTLEQLMHDHAVSYIAVGSRKLFTPKHAEELLAKNERKVIERRTKK